MKAMNVLKAIVRSANRYLKHGHTILYALFFAAIISTVGNAQSYNPCPSGSTYDKTDNICTTPPTCMYGTFNPQTGTCQGAPQCLQGYQLEQCSTTNITIDTQVTCNPSSTSGNECLQNFSCPDGSYEKHATGTCWFAPEPDCSNSLKATCMKTASPFCSGGTLIDQECYGATVKDSTPAQCPSGYTLTMQGCVDSVTPQCPSGYKFLGESCLGVGLNQPNNTNATCPSGYTFQQIQCLNTAPLSCPSNYMLYGQACIPTANPTCPSGYQLVSGNPNAMCAQLQSPQCPSGYSYAGNGECETTTSPSYSCPSGYSYSNGTCVGTCTPPKGQKTCTPPTTSPTASCPSGYSLQGSQCVATTPASCPSGYSLQGNECVQANPTMQAQCPSGYTLQGMQCINYNTSAAVPPSCPSGYSLGGNECYQTTTASLNCGPNATMDSYHLCLAKYLNCPTVFPFNKYLNACIGNKHMICSSYVDPNTGQTINPTYDQQSETCDSPPTCPAGFTYSPSTQLCEAPTNLNTGLDNYFCDGITPCYICTSTTITDLNNTKACVVAKPLNNTGSQWECPIKLTPCSQQQSCPDGGTYDSSLGLCVIKPAACPTGTAFNPTLGVCQELALCRGAIVGGKCIVNSLCGSISDLCPPGSNYNSKLNACKVPLSCPTQGFVYYGNGICISSNSVCPQGYTYNVTSGLCEGPAMQYSCPYPGHTCKEVGGMSGYYCSPYSCSSVNPPNSGNSGNSGGGNGGGGGGTFGSGSTPLTGAPPTIKPNLNNCSVQNIRIFSGEADSCRVADIWDLFTNCCRKGPSFFLTKLLVKCKKQEKYLAKLRSWGTLQGANGQCHYIGEFCSKRIHFLFGSVCVQHSKSYCCFPSALARIIQVGAHDQEGIPWGSPSSPNCAGLTLEQFQKIDWSNPDIQGPLQDWIQNEIHANITPKVSSSVNQAATNMINNYLNSSQ